MCVRYLKSDGRMRIGFGRRSRDGAGKKWQRSVEVLECLSAWFYYAAWVPGVPECLITRVPECLNAGVPSARVPECPSA